MITIFRRKKIKVNNYKNQRFVAHDVQVNLKLLSKLLFQFGIMSHSAKRIPIPTSRL